MKDKIFKLSQQKRIAIVYRVHTPEAVKLAEKLALFLKKKKVHVFTAPEQKLIKNTELLLTSVELKKMNLVIVLGGDGTYLRAVRLLKGEAVPILGFNMGYLGFLTAHKSSDVFALVEQTLKNQMITQNRTRIQILVKHAKGSKVSFDALNDVVIERGSFSQLISTAVYFESTLVNQIKADGVIISTPTGSTAYNLAAGGPVLHPDVQGLVLTPVAPHSLTSRPLIFPDDKKISFKLDEQTATAHLIVDGQKVLELVKDDEVIISRCKKDHIMIRQPGHSFFQLLKDKLKFGDRYASGT